MNNPKYKTKKRLEKLYKKVLRRRQVAKKHLKQSGDIKWARLKRYREDIVAKKNARELNKALAKAEKVQAESNFSL